MKQVLLGLLMVLACSTAARADALADAAKAVDARSYDVALRIYTQLAQNGDAEAQFRLGQMVWYGEGTPADLPRARELFQKSAAAGNANAASALVLLQQREARSADIAYWTDRYDGADLKATANCKAPVIPAVSKTNEEIVQTFSGMSAWRVCYNGFVKKMDSVLPVGAAIPAELANMMSEQEHAKALNRLNNVYADLTAAQASSAQATIDGFDRWMASTEKYANEHNAEMKGRELVMRDQIEMMKQQYARIGRDYYPPPRPNGIR